MAKNIDFKQDIKDFLEENFDTNKRPFKRIKSSLSYIMRDASENTLQDFLNLPAGTIWPRYSIGFFGAASYFTMSKKFEECGIDIKECAVFKNIPLALKEIKRKKKRIPLKKYTFDRRKNKLKSLVNDLKEKGKGFVKDPEEFERLLQEISKQI